MSRRLCLVVLVLALAVAAGLLIKRLNSAPLIPSYRFLAGRELKVSSDKDDYDINWKVAQYLYSFPCDVNGLCATASAELHSLGFAEMKLPGAGQNRVRIFLLPNVNQSFATIEVMILKHQKLSANVTPKQVARDPQAGWVTVEVVYTRPKSRWHFYAKKLKKWPR